VCAGIKQFDGIDAPARSALPRPFEQRKSIADNTSGIIIHHTYLPLLIRLLRTYSASPNLIPPTIRSPAPDLVIQDCIRGGPDSICQRKPLPGPVDTITALNPDSRSLWSSWSWRGGSSRTRTRTRTHEKSSLIISSRMVLDHIGGMATTTEGKLWNNDKWRCGWRHPFHGQDGVEVVVV
jgi:hypothetical protein